MCDELRAYVVEHLEDSTGVLVVDEIMDVKKTSTRSELHDYPRAPVHRHRRLIENAQVAVYVAVYLALLH